MGSEDDSIEQSVASRRERLLALRAAQELSSAPEPKDNDDGEEEEDQQQEWVSIYLRCLLFLWYTENTHGYWNCVAEWSFVTTFLMTRTFRKGSLPLRCSPSSKTLSMCLHQNLRPRRYNSTAYSVVNPSLFFSLSLHFVMCIFIYIYKKKIGSVSEYCSEET